jgi:hypothetical protein
MICRILTGLLFAGLLSNFAFAQHTREIPVSSSANLQVVLEEVHGRIAILASDRPLMKLEMKSDSDEEDELGVEIVSTGNRIEIKGTSTHSNRTYTLEVPAYSSIVARITRNKDELRIVGVRGAIEIITRDADVELYGVEGALLVHTLRGDVQAEFANALNSLPGSISTGVGAINVRLPNTVKRTVYIHCMEEELQSTLQFEKSFQSLGNYRRVHAVTKINGGGPSLYINTIRGEVSIAR